MAWRWQQDSHGSRQTLEEQTLEQTLEEQTLEQDSHGSRQTLEDMLPAYMAEPRPHNPRTGRCTCRSVNLGAAQCATGQQELKRTHSLQHMQCALNVPQAKDISFEGGGLWVFHGVLHC